MPDKTPAQAIDGTMIGNGIMIVESCWPPIEAALRRAGYVVTEAVDEEPTGYRDVEVPGNRFEYD